MGWSRLIVLGPEEVGVDEGAAPRPRPSHWGAVGVCEFAAISGSWILLLAFSSLCLARPELWAGRGYSTRNLLG